MVLHPDTQRRAQEEIDKVVGTERLPQMGDRASLPYVEAVILEVLRLRPPVSMSECDVRVCTGSLLTCTHRQCFGRRLRTMSMAGTSSQRELLSL